MLPGAALGAIVGPFSGQLYDSVGAKLPLRLGSVLVLIGVLGMSVMGYTLSNLAILAWYIFFMAGMGIHYGNLMTNGLRTIDQTANSDGNAIFNTTQQFMAALGTSMSAAIVAAAQAKATNQAAATATGSVHALLVLLILLAVEVIVILMLTRTKRDIA